MTTETSCAPDDAAMEPSASPRRPGGGAGGSTHVISLLDFHLDDVHGTEPMKGAGCSSGAPRLDPKMDTSVSPKQEPDAGLICSMKGPSSR
jgi:hypothetical protein